MKRIKHEQILVKRIKVKEKTYDFILDDKKTALHIIKNTKNKTEGTKFVRPNCFERLIFYSAKFFRENKKRIILAIILFALTYALKNVFDYVWISP